MNVRVIRRAFGLLLADIVIIIGIFLLQFRTDSNIIEKIGNLQITLSESQNEKNISILRNKLQVSYNGINFYCDDQNPVKILYKDKSEPENIQLTSWEKIEDLGFIFYFTDEVSIYMSLTDSTPEATLSIIADVPKDTESLFLPYKSIYTMKIISEENNSIVLNDKKNSWMFQANSLSDGFVTFGNDDFVASYGIYNEEEKFSFVNLVESYISPKDSYEKTVGSFSEALISAFKSTPENSYSEQSVVAYVAAMGAKGQYKAAIDEIPQSFKKSDKRTYLSAPYFNSLEKMDDTLEKTMASVSASISKSAETGSLDILTARNIVNYMCIHSKPTEVYRIITNALNSSLNDCSIAQITGIMNVYNGFNDIKSDYATRLKPIMDICVKKIEDSCIYDGEKVLLTENGIFVSVAQAVETGIALQRYAISEDDQINKRAGQIIVESYLSDLSSYDLRTLTTLYPVICYDNWYYPHFVKMNVENEKWIWAWTCAEKISYVTDTGIPNTIDIDIDFPLEGTHYVIFKSIPSFRSIYVYGIAFRTDSRFETYNSSGYIYKPATKTLLFKSRHKSETEKVRLVTAE